MFLRSLRSPLNLPISSSSRRCRYYASNRAPPTKLHRVPEPLQVPEYIPRPSYILNKTGRPSVLKKEEYAERKTLEQMEKMRRSAILAREALQFGLRFCQVGVTADIIDRKVQEFIMERGAYPAGIGFHGFPRSICISVNEVVVHGIPDERPLHDGDILNLDVALLLDGMYGDNSDMALIGNVDRESNRLVRAVREAVDAAITCVKPGASLRQIGEAVCDVADSYDYSVVDFFGGHFIGRELHMLPNVIHTRNQLDMELQPGMTFTIEPILCEGTNEIYPLEDGWAYKTKDGKRSAQKEHTVLVTEDGCDVLTMR